MFEFSFVNLYVDDPASSATFYADLLGRPAVQSSATYVMFRLRPGVLLGLWQRRTVSPASTSAESGAGELAFTVADAAVVDQTHADWAARGLHMAGSPEDLSFGRTFVALDPDGHRLRVFAAPPR